MAREARYGQVGVRMTKGEKDALEVLRQVLDLDTLSDAMRAALDWFYEYLANPKEFFELERDLNRLGHTKEGYLRFAEYLEEHPEAIKSMRERIIQKARLKY